MMPTYLQPALINSKLNEYIIVVQPHEDLCTRIYNIRRQFAAQYELPPLKYAKPNITLLHFKQYESMEKRIIQRLNNIAAACKNCTIQLQNFGSFPTHTIFIKVANPNSILQLSSAIKPIQSILKPDNQNKPHFITEPHMMIARKLLPWQFEKGWEQYENLTFSDSFIASEWILLKRLPDSNIYVLTAKFSLQGMLQPQQTALF